MKTKNILKGIYGKNLLKTKVSLSYNQNTSYFKMKSKNTIMSALKATYHAIL